MAGKSYTAADGLYRPYAIGAGEKKRKEEEQYGPARLKQQPLAHIHESGDHYIYKHYYGEIHASVTNKLFRKVFKGHIA